MSKYTEIFDFMRECPRLKDLWSIAATEEIGTKVILPVGASEPYEINETLDVRGGYECDMTPYPSIYEDFQINCYKTFDPQDNSAPSENINVLSLDDVQSICDWVAEQNENRNLPKITGKKVVSIECFPINPQIRGIDRQINSICYFITVRIRYVNTFKRVSVEYGN
jgi:hypothetical protein